MEIITKQQAKALGLKRYHGGPCKNCGGTERLVSSRGCIACQLASKERWRVDNLEKVAAYVRGWRVDNPEKCAAWSKRWINANRERFNARSRAQSAARYARKLNATPPWAYLFNDQYVGIYAEARDLGHEVDHIHPLIPRDKINGPYGLHVPWNLRIIPPTANRRKNNAMPEGSDAEISLWHACHSYIKIVEAAD